MVSGVQYRGGGCSDQGASGQRHPERCLLSNDDHGPCEKDDAGGNECYSPGCRECSPAAQAEHCGACEPVGQDSGRRNKDQANQHPDYGQE